MEINNKMTIPDWLSLEKTELSNSKFTLIQAKVPFPGYIDNSDHPFGYCNALTNDSIDWASSDSPAEFEKNLKHMPSDWKYRTQSVTYKVNASGYRTEEWNDIDWKNSIVILGCSCTFGVGLSEHETISSVLCKLTGRQVINLGVPGGSNELILHNASMLFERFGTPYGVVVNWTTTDRMRYFQRHTVVDVGPWDEHNHNDNLHKLYNSMVGNEYNLQMRNYFISRAMNAIWQGRTNYISLSYFDVSAHYMIADAVFTIDNEARDCNHPGYNNSITVAKYIKDRLI